VALAAALTAGLVLTNIMPAFDEPPDSEKPITEKAPLMSGLWKRIACARSANEVV